MSGDTDDCEMKKMSERLPVWLAEKFSTIEEGFFPATAIRNDWMEELLAERQSLTEQLSRADAKLGSFSYAEVGRLNEQLAQVTKEKETLSKALDGWKISYYRDLDASRAECVRYRTLLEEMLGYTKKGGGSGGMLFVWEAEIQKVLGQHGGWRTHQRRTP